MANQTRVCVLAVLVSEGAKTRLSGQNKNLAFLIEGLCDFLILDCFLCFFFSSSLRFVWPIFIVNTMERHNIPYGCVCRGRGSVIFVSQVNLQCNRTETNISVRKAYYGISFNLL